MTCHTTGFEYTSGWRSAAATPHLKGTQCENCHGPASKHVSDPEQSDFRQPMQVTAEQADKGRLCNRCHDEDNSPKFEFTKYWSQIVHNGLDEYTDPKVHRGITPEGGQDTRARRPRSETPKDTPPMNDPAILDATAPASPATGSRFERLVAKYHEDHSNPVNHVLHVWVGWPIMAAAVVLVPFRPLWSLGLFVTSYAIMWTGHFVVRTQPPNDLPAPDHPVCHRLGGDPGPGSRVGPAGFAGPEPVASISLLGNLPSYARVS